MCVKVALLFIFATVALCQDDGDIPLIDEIDFNKYIGLWYQTHTSPLAIATFEKDGLCGTAEYALYWPDTITVVNSQRLKEPNGTYDEFTGYAYTTNVTGQLGLYLEGAGGGDYWIMKLGPIGTYFGFEQYEYSLVSEPSKLLLFVLARDVQKFKELYEEEVLQFLDDNGFRGINGPVESYHGDDCLYPIPPGPDRDSNSQESYYGF